MNRRRNPKRVSKAIARTHKHAELLIAATKRTGDISLARRMAGMSPDDLKVVRAYPGVEERLQEAERAGAEARIETAIQCLEAAKEVALAVQDTNCLLEIAKILAPERHVYPAERERAKARTDGGQGTGAQVQVNIALGNLAERLQSALRVDAITEIEDVPRD